MRIVELQREGFLSLFLLGSYNWYWLTVLVGSTFTMSLLAVVLPAAFHKRHHNGLKAINEFLARHQLGFIAYYFAILLTTRLTPERMWLVIGLVTLSFGASVLAAKWASADHQDFLLQKDHHCPPDPPSKRAEECTKKVNPCTKWEMCRKNLALLSISIGLGGILLPFWLPQKASPQPQVSVEIPHKPQGSPIVKVVPNKDQPEWYGDHAFWLQKEGDRHKEARLIAAYALGEVQYVASRRTIPFTIVLSVPEGYALSSHAAFRDASAQGHPLLEQLNPTPSDETFREFKVSVPECARQDKVVVLFRLDGKYANASINVTDIVRAHIEGGE